MKILFISMPSIHTIRWIDNLIDSNHELFWFDVMHKGKLDTNDKVLQFTDWKKRKIRPIKGEYFLSRKAPFLYEKIRPFLEVTENEYLEKIINEIKPDVVHSFEMQSCSYQIRKTMEKHPDLKWIYSCWGNDLYYYKNFKEHRAAIKKVLKRVNFIHTDCQRDIEIAKSLGFKGKHLGVIPGGTGYKLDQLQKYKIPIGQRKIILVKGYEHIFGRGLTIIKALEEITEEIKDYEVIVFAAHPIVIEYVKQKKLPFITLDRHGLKHDKVLELMGKALVYIGNSISDGMSNTLLEAIVMGAFPIQSNPGNVSEEIINDKINGLIINNPESTLEIKNLILDALKDRQRLIMASEINSEIAKTRLDFETNRNKVLAIYNLSIQ
jgi:glycosyltransferase involved in cell wall biosynthesis